MTRWHQAADFIQNRHTCLFSAVRAKEAPLGSGGARKWKADISMKLYITPGSPYARIARIVVFEKQLEDRVELVVAQTRSVDSPYYRIAASGRVPYLVRDDGVGLE